MKKIIQMVVIVCVSFIAAIAHSGCDKEYDQYYNSSEKLYNFSHQAISIMTKAPGTFNLGSGDYLVYEINVAKKEFNTCLKNNKLWSVTSVTKGPKMRKMAQASADEHEKAKILYLSQKSK